MSSILISMTPFLNTKKTGMSHEWWFKVPSNVLATSSLNFCILRILEIEIITNYNSKKGWTSLYKSPIDPHNQLKQPLFTRFTIGPQRKDLLYKLQKSTDFCVLLKQYKRMTIFACGSKSPHHDSGISLT